ncbi:hypothetical protein B0H67DRAFT_676274 [Lasiosphaeris hirsuta]|uniref:Uncharacterized protein n=1 Tax=Lasiosphaeris hirsuta TaxID=260670 RepID=A0AA39ZRL5_9PEZI|nr:hypothetical protein B0H67DRAFT_676274 [Lasiosphaeris hirsuta]
MPLAHSWPYRLPCWSIRNSKKSEPIQVEQPIPNYKPIFLQTKYLVLFALYLCALISVLEWGCRKFPSSQGYASIPSDTPPDGHTILFSAPLVNPRAAFTSKSSPTKPEGTGTPIPKASLHFVKRQNTTWASNGTAPRPPLAIGDHIAYPPEWMDILAPLNGSQTQNVSTNSSQALNRSSSIDRRHPPQGNFGSLARMTVGLELSLSWDKTKSNWQAVFQWYRPSLFSPGYGTRFGTPDWWSTCPDDDDYVNERRANAYAWGLVTCTGQAFVFHDNSCWQGWTKVVAKQTELLRMEMTRQQLDYDQVSWEGEAQWDGDVAQRCPGPLLGCNGDYDAADSDLCIYHSGNTQDEEADATVVVDMLNTQGLEVTTVRATLQVYYLVGPSGVVTGTTTRLRALPTDLLTSSFASAISMESSALSGAGSSNYMTPSETTIAILDSHGSATATITVGLPKSPPAATATTPHNPAGSSSFHNSPDGDSFHILSRAEYWMVSFLPVILAVTCSILAEMVSSNLHALLPFAELTRAGGASAHSLVSRRGIITGITTDLRFLRRFKDPGPLLCDLLVALSAIITTLASEAVGIKLGGNCRPDNFTGCYLGVAVFLTPARAVQALLSVSLLLVAWLVILLPRWQSGVMTDPRSIMAVGDLIQDQNLRRLFGNIRTSRNVVLTRIISNQEVLRELNNYRFFLSHSSDASQGSQYYGITAQRVGCRPSPKKATGGQEPWPRKAFRTAAIFACSMRGQVRKRVPFVPVWPRYSRATKDRILDCCGISCLCGLIILITYYNATQFPETAFEKFMNNQDSGVRVLFTGFGVLLTFFWDSYHERVAMLEPYRQLWQRPQSYVVTVPPPVTVFSSVISSLLQRQWFISVVALTNVMSKFLPILLSAVPFSPIQTWELHMICAWTSIGGLVGMNLLLVYGLLFVKYPDMPIDVGSLAGQIYYLCDSEVLDDFQGISLLDTKACNERLQKRRYGFGGMVGVSGEKRIGVYVVDNLGDS